MDNGPGPDGRQPGCRRTPGVKLKGLKYFKANSSVWSWLVSLVPLLLIITGLPCTGKTTLGLRLAGELRLPFVHKDGIKELLFERIGWRDRTYSKQLSLASYDVLYYFIESLLRAGESLIVESNFKPDIDTAKFLDLAERMPFRPCQILLQADGEVLLERFKHRAESGLRHPGHVDHLTLEELQPVLFRGREDPLRIGGQVIQVDTTDFDAIDYSGLYRTLAELFN